MSNKNNLYLLKISQLVFLFFLLILIPAIFIRQKDGISQIFFENILPLDNKHTYIQKFITNKDNLNSVSILLKNPALKSRDQVIIQLFNSKNELLQSLTLSGEGIEDPGWVKLKFGPINSKTGDAFYIQVTSNAQNDNDLYIYGNHQSQELNFKTTYKSINFKQSLIQAVNFQKEKLPNLNKIYLLFYLISITLIV
jgi:hypothetical protein